MNEEILKGVIDGITADKNLIDKTYKKMKNAPTRRIIGNKFILSVSSGFLIVIIGIFIFNSSYKVGNSKNVNNSFFSRFPQIEKNYALFDSMKQNKSLNVLGPEFPDTFKRLIGETDYIVSCTIEDVGDYFRKSRPTCFGSKIYIVRINKILYGKMDEKAENIIPVVEKFFAESPTQPYSRRPPEEWKLNTGEQYILYLTKQDETDCYGLAGLGFGVFSREYIEDTVKSTNIEDIKKLIQKGVREIYGGMVHYADLHYKLYALYTKEKFLK
jgi:hypothetical protein